MTTKKSEKVYCQAAKMCGGCQMLGIPYKRQLQIKQQRVEEMLHGLCQVYPITGMEEPLHYRNKAHAVFDFRKGQIISGTYKEGTHQVVPVEDCLIEDEQSDQIIQTIRGMLKSFKIPAYREDNGSGLLRHVVIRRGFATGQIMVILVTASSVFPSSSHFVKALLKNHPEITTVVQNINARATSVILGEKEKVLFGEGYIEDVLCGCTFRISSKSFYQVNPVQTEKLYTKAMQLAGLTGEETVLDAYCGIGTIGIIAAKEAGRVIGVELNRNAVQDARDNAKRNQIPNIRFYNGDASQFASDLAAQKERVDVAFLDPPRSGSTEQFIKSLAKLAPKRIVYISCNPETLARDLHLFQKFDYQAEEAWPYDLFPFTWHIETACRLSKNKSSGF